MNHGKALVAATLGILLLTAIIAAQTPKPKPKPRATPPATAAKPKPTPATKATPTATPAPPAGTLAVVNGQPIMLGDLDPNVREVAEGFEKNMPGLRHDALEARVNTLLLESEAQKRKVTSEQLMDAEVNNRVPEPTEAEIKAVYDANRQQIGNADIATVRPQIVNYLRSQAAQKLASEFVARLRSTHAVVMGTADVNAPNLAPATVLATVDGRTITVAEFEERLKPFVYKLRREVFESEMHALDSKINQMLLEAEAKKRNQTPEEVFKLEVTDKVRTPTDAEVTKFYEDNKARIQGDLASLRKDIADLLLDQQRNRLETEFARRLRAGATAQVFLTEPEPPVQAISTDDDPARGEAKAPVTVVVFTDFQCPACAATHPIVDETLNSYGNRVRLVVRDYPLPQHTNARKAAEAADAAAAQGKFFEYIAVLFKNQSALDEASLKKYAADLGLNTARFNAALESGEYAAEVEHDVKDGDQYGVDSTPSIFVNGVRLRDLTAEALRAAIDRALARGNTQLTPQRATK